ncbi:MAG: DUF262 domain-containing protein [Anaerolineales bacterium]|nr:DUF262 domain-containing protein [Anaerolineales bacterium]
MQQLTNIDTIFKKKIFRIPDYQRGYAWQKRQLTDFWEDLISLEDGRNHYTGVLSLEETPKEKWEQWESDRWIIENRGYTPYLVVDGQQRLTTCVILIQAILETAQNLSQNNFQNKDDFEICDMKISDIRKDFIFIKRSNSIVRSYIFGYEKDNPSYEFLKTRIFNEESSSALNQETLYTHNLENAKAFFKENLIAIAEDQRLAALENIFQKVTRHLLFNEYILQNDVDVFVAFETMNNRGKKLSDLELLKNRLIYLTTLYREDIPEKAELRKRINDAWKEIYYQLGKNKLNPLNDDDFLRAHWIMFFKYSRNTGGDYINFLLDEQFSPKKVLERVPIFTGIQEVAEIRDEEDEAGLENDELEEAEMQAESKLKIQEVSDFAASIQKTSEHWYNSFNPLSITNWSTEEQNWVDRLNRIGISYFRPLVVSSFMNKEVTSGQRIDLFKAIERFIFIGFRLSQTRSNYRSSEFYNASRELYYGSKTTDEIINALNTRLAFAFNENGSFRINSFFDFIETKFKYGSGYYSWSGIRYFLYEYEQHLFNQSKNKTQKISWDQFITQKDMVTIEHILPQSPTDKCWRDNFGFFEKDQLNALTNSLGNLLALSQPKNSSLQNHCYSEKRANREVSHGYFNGSYSENRVAEQYQDWTFESIRERGLALLEFMEERWAIRLGDEYTKLRLLKLDFLTDDQIPQWQKAQNEFEIMDTDEDQDTDETEASSRRDWEGRADPGAMKIVDILIEIIATISQPVVHYNNNHISIETIGKNFIWLYPKKSASIRVRLKLYKDRDEVVRKLASEGLDCKNGTNPSFARLYLTLNDLNQNKKHIVEAINTAERLSH